MKIIFPSWGVRLLVLGVCLSASTHASQHILPAGTGSEYVSSQETITYSAIYSVSSPQTATETGLGLRVHYNSSLLTPMQNQLYNMGAQPVGGITDDSENFDNDPLTDKYYVLAWLDINAQWPGATVLPLNLFNAEFETSANFTQDTAIRITASATAQNNDLIAPHLKICPKPTVSLSSIVSAFPNQAIPESQNSAASFQLTSNLPAECGNLELNYTVSGTATPGSDYTALTQPTISYNPALPGTSFITVNAIDDNEVEDDETIILTLNEGSDYVLGSPSSMALTIKSEDITVTLPEVNLSTGKTTVTEGSSGSMIVYATRSREDLSQPLEVLLQLSGTASAGSDYQPFPTSITIPAGKEQAFAVLILKDDSSNETQETISISIAANEQYQRGSSSTLQLTIDDDESSQHTNLATDKAAPTTLSNKIPTLNEWMLILMSLLLTVFALFRISMQTGSKD